MLFSSVLSLSLLATTNALSLDVSSPDSIKSVAKDLAGSIIAIYNNTPKGTPPGLFGGPYFFWSAGAVWGGLLDYAHYTGDTQYNQLVFDAIAFQIGQDDFAPTNQTKALGNDDQAIWALTAMTAAELGFDNLPKSPSWVQLAENVFNAQVGRWDDKTCAGGLRWQVFPFNNGYDYKNALSNGAFFQLATRLARYTGNQTYADWAEKIFTWSENVGFITKSYAVYDGSNVLNACSSTNQIQWTINSALYLYGSAIMYDITAANSTWKSRTTGLFNATSVFFENPKPGTNIMVEVACEIRNPNACSQDQTFFKAFLARDLARTAKIAPFMFNAIIPKLSASAAAAAKQCNGTDSAVSCGQRWNQDTMDSNTGLGQQLSALDIVQALLAEKATQPLRAPSNSTGSSTPTTTITGALSPPTPTASSTISTIPTSAASTPQAGLYSLFAIFAVVSVSLF